MLSTRPKQVDTEPPALSPLSIARILWKRRVLIPVMVATCSAICAIVVLKLPAVYKAEALVLVDSQKIPEKFVSSTVSSGVADRLAAISQQIMSTTRLLKIVHDLDLYKEDQKTKTREEIIEQMRRDITVSVQKDNWATGKPIAFKVGYQGKNAAVVAEVANQLANLYIEENLQTREVEASGTSDFIDNQLDQAKRQLDEEELKVAKFKQAHNGSLPEQENPLLSTLTSLRLQLQGAQDSLNRAQQNKLMLETALTTEESAAANLERALQVKRSTPGLEPSAGAPVSADDKTVVELRQKLQELESRYTPDHPDIVSVKAEITQLVRHQSDEVRTRTSLAGTKTTAPKAEEDNSDTSAPVSPAVLQQRGKIAMLQTQLAAVKHDIQFQETERQRVLQQIEAAQMRVEQLPMVEQEMASLTRDYETSRTNYKSLLDKQIAAQMSTDMERRQKSERFEIIDPARVPEKPFKPNRPLLLGGAVIVSLLISVLIGFGLELRTPVLLGEWELPAHVLVLGRVPVIHFQPAPRLLQGMPRTMAVSSAAFALVIGIFAYYLLRVRS